LRDAAPGSIGKLTSQAIAKVRDSRSNWTPDELAVLNEAANGTPTVRALAMIGRLAPTNPTMAGLHAVLGGGAHSPREARASPRRPHSAPERLAPAQRPTA
jgi:hypothetical protein